MTKREMIIEMIDGLYYSGGNKRVIDNRCKARKERVTEVYNFYQKTEKTQSDKAFCINLLTKF